MYAMCDTAFLAPLGIVMVRREVARRLEYIRRERCELVGCAFGAKFLGRFTSNSSLIIIPNEIIYLVHLHVGRPGWETAERSASLREAPPK